ncbi:MAG: HAMP domain-containing sensor histidine kinase [Actinomycetota bacterium]|nr:HAMP domain-containing sensor histidine kinase [Actinomycetota bacterium]
MKVPNYTTRMILAYLLLALLAGILGVGGIYRIRGSLQQMQEKSLDNKRQVKLALDLHEAVEQRRKAETFYLNIRSQNYARAWDRADKQFSQVLDTLRRTQENKSSYPVLASIGRANSKVRQNWFVVRANSSVKATDNHAPQDISRLESLIDGYTEANSLATGVVERNALRETNLTLFGNLLFAGLVLGLAAVMAIYLSKTLRKPLADLLTATQRIAQGQLGHHIDLDRTDEIGALAAAFNEMSSELHRKDIQIMGQIGQLLKTKSLLESYSYDLEKKNKEMESFIYSVSHDLKAPLIAIQGFLTMFADEFSSTLSTKAGFYLGRVKANSEHMQTLIRQLLELSRAGQTVKQFTSVSTRQIVQQVIDDLHLQIEAKNAEILVLGDWPTVAGEPIRIRQALTNLVDNALHYSNPGVPIKIEIFVKEVDGAWRWHVKDNGIGIDPSFQAKVFEMFERLTDSHEKNANGTGIGLAIVKKIAESHGGEAGVESKLGKGSTFYFEISSKLNVSGKANVEVQV